MGLLSCLRERTLLRTRCSVHCLTSRFVRYNTPQVGKLMSRTHQNKYLARPLVSSGTRPGKLISTSHPLPARVHAPRNKQPRQPTMLGLEHPRRGNLRGDKKGAACWQRIRAHPAVSCISFTSTIGYTPSRHPPDEDVSVAASLPELRQRLHWFGWLGARGISGRYCVFFNSSSRLS